MLEFAPSAPEFDWWEVNGKQTHWRFGERITINRPGWALRWKLIVLAIDGIILAWLWLDLISQVRSVDVSPSAVLIDATWIIMTLGIASVVVLWVMGPRQATIDWRSDQIVVQQGAITQRYPIAALKRIELCDGSSLVETVELVLVLPGARIQLLETHYVSNPVERFEKLATLGRRLSESLNVPLKRASVHDSKTALGMSNLELADKYVEIASSLETHGDSAAIKGDATSEQLYRDEAIFMYRYALELNPRHNAPYLALGRLSGNLDVQNQSIQISIGEDTDDVDSLLARADMYHRKGKIERCLADLDRAVQIFPSSQTLVNRGQVLFFQGRHESALEDFERALTFDPENASVHDWCSSCWRRIYHRSQLRKHQEYAINAIDQAIRFDPSNPQYQRDRTRLLANTRGRCENAITLLNHQSVEVPADVMLYKHRGQLHLKQRDGASAAVRDFTKMIEILEQEPMPVGESQTSQQCAIAMAYRLRSEAHKKDGNLHAADQDLALAGDLEC